MELGYEIRAELRQQLSPMQLQSLEILSMDGMELQEFLQNEYLENPLLDLKQGRSRGLATEELDKTRDLPMEEPDLVKRYLLDQLPGNLFTDRQWKLADYLTDCLEDTGFLTMTEEEIKRRTGASGKDVEKVLGALRELEPYGIFAPDLKHCLLKQLEKKGLQGAAVWSVVEEHLKDAAEGRISSISRKLKLSTLEVRRCLEQIAKLNPRPMNELQEGKSHYIVPDLVIRRQEGGWAAELQDDWVEDYQINDYYLRMMEEVKEEELAEYFRRKLERVRFVMNSIAQRRRTLLDIAEVMIRRQQDYLEGQTYLTPMTMSEVAEELHIHASTVSRAVRGKYIQHPRGTVLMKQWFSSPVAAKGDAAVGTMQIKELLRTLVDQEDKTKPYSDLALVQALKEQNIRVSRRTVAKYREEMGIPGSFDRKDRINL